MKYSLINVSREYDGMVDGVWLQNHTGTIESASEIARATERANSNKITVAVVDDLGYSEPNYSFRTALKRLDIAQTLNLNNNGDKSKMDLREFLSYFDFDYDIVSPGGKYETRIRQELLEDGDLCPSDLVKDLICLVDKQGANLGDIGIARFPVCQDSIEKIIDRMDIYVQDSVIDEFIAALENREIDASDMSLNDMITKCKELNIGEGEVCYRLAEAITNSDSVYIKECFDSGVKSQVQIKRKDETRVKSITVPVDIGDSLYMESRGKVGQYIVNSILIYEKGRYFGAYCAEFRHQMDVPEQWLGSRAFLTEKEAIDDYNHFSKSQNTSTLVEQISIAEKQRSIPDENNDSKAFER